MIPRIFRVAALTLITAQRAVASLTSRDEAPVSGGFDWISNNASLPKVLLYDAGGTILKNSNHSRMDNIAYGLAPPTTSEALIGNVSEVLSVAQIAIVPFNSGGLSSSSANSSLYLNITQHANKYICPQTSDIVGAVMIHGSNTLEETTFGVDLTFNCSKLFVATGSVRPDDHVSPDGRANLFNAVAAAASPSSRDRGALVALNDCILSAYYAAKLHANNPDAFGTAEQGALGVSLAGQPFYFFGAALPNGRPAFDVHGTEVLPAVSVLYINQGFDAALVGAAAQNGARGLVVIGPGAAGLSTEAAVAINALSEAGVPVVVVGRPVGGSGVPSAKPSPFIKSSFLDAAKSRIMLQLAIAAGYSVEEVRALFETPLHRAVFTSANLGWFF